MAMIIAADPDGRPINQTRPPSHKSCALLVQDIPYLAKGLTSRFTDKFFASIFLRKFSLSSARNDRLVQGERRVCAPMSANRRMKRRTPTL
jgi:hypothetical protein